VYKRACVFFCVYVLLNKLLVLVLLVRSSIMLR